MPKSITTTDRGKKNLDVLSPTHKKKNLGFTCCTPHFLRASLQNFKIAILSLKKVIFRLHMLESFGKKKLEQNFHNRISGKKFLK